MREKTMPNKTIEPNHRFKKRLMAYGSVLLAISIILIPLPALLLNILWRLDFIFILLTLLFVLHSKKANDFSFLLLLLLILIAFGIMVQFSYISLILFEGESLNDWIIFTALPFIKILGGIMGLITGI
jgi:flagellar biosynthesis component FlhA